MSFLKAVTMVGGSTLLSRVLGLIRDILTAVFLGAGPASDAFFIAFKLPNFFRRITAEGAFSFAFVPMFSKMLENKKLAREFAEDAQAVMIAFLLPFTIIIVIAMPWILHIVAPGIANDPARFDYAVEFSRITFPFIFIVSLTALLGGVMNSLHKFAAFALAPVFLNIVLIGALLLSKRFFPTAAHAMSYGVIVAGIVQLLWMLINIHRAGFSLRLKLPRITPQVKRMFNLMGPGILGALASQMNMFIDMFLSSMLPIGSISYLYYADRLYELPLGVIGVAVGTALLPMLSKAIKNNDGSERELLSNACEASFALSLPSALGLMILAKPIMTVLFERGEFTHDDAIKSSYALIAYSIGIPAFVWARTFSTSFFAREDTKTPVKIGIVCAVVNIVLAILLIIPLKHVGIALATAIAMWLNFAMLIYSMKKRGYLHLTKKVWIRVSKIALSGFVMAAVAWGLNAYLFRADLGQFAIIAELAGMIAISGLVYFASLYFFGIFNLVSLKRFLKR